MTFPFALIDDTDAEVIGGVQIHVEILPLSTPPVVDGLAGTGADLPTVLIVTGVALLAIGAVVLARRVRRRSTG
ncbi:hypothetical protein SRABI76_02508 [Microbacterium oxydans]|uniref:Gram-positive cocci surface proteins LPxTG domain-containing protein n=1 Tax=Microbacterium oxydans TaxID=82380 RepID=A0A0F0LBK1_9MICO|nr:hypothetical protein [Microbacterium oxydans]KJL30582.1 hypothetical protein RS83_00651 [Microbacterium oxydans]CAH0221107.1 hypothetical protein SRABI76_02508 [Microbacterium oxydans]